MDTEVIYSEDTEELLESLDRALALDDDVLISGEEETSITYSDETQQILENILLQAEVMNRLLVMILGMQIFIFTFLVFDWIYKMIKHNITNLI